MSALRSLRESNAPKGGGRTPNTFAVVLQVSSAVLDKAGDKEFLKLSGTVLNEVPGAGRDLPVAVEFRGDDADRAVSNFIKGHGGSRKIFDKAENASGSVLTLESCYLTEQVVDDRMVISSRWLNTLQKANEATHSDRSFLEGVMATSPRVSFENPDFRPGNEEPRIITIPVSQEKFTARVETEHGTFSREFDRAWGIERLNRLPKDAKPSVFIDTVEPNNAKLVTSEEELRAALTEQLGRGTRSLVLLRVTDGEEVIDRLVYGQYKKEGDQYLPDPEATIEQLFQNNVFRDIANDDLLAGLADGTLKIDAVPGYRLGYAGNPLKDDNAAYKLVSDLKANKVTRYEIMFGKEPNRFASVVLPGVARNDTIAGFSPINVIADRPGRHAAHEIATAHIDAKAQAAVARDPEPEPESELADSPSP